MVLNNLVILKVPFNIHLQLLIEGEKMSEKSFLLLTLN